MYIEKKKFEYFLKYSNVQYHPEYFGGKSILLNVGFSRVILAYKFQSDYPHVNLEGGIRYFWDIHVYFSEIFTDNVDCSLQEIGISKIKNEFHYTRKVFEHRASNAADGRSTRKSTERGQKVSKARLLYIRKYNIVVIYFYTCLFHASTRGAAAAASVGRCVAAARRRISAPGATCPGATSQLIDRNRRADASRAYRRRRSGSSPIRTNRYHRLLSEFGATV